MKNLLLPGITLLLFCLSACTQNPSAKMKEVKNDQVRIDYQMTGDGPVTLLFVHGSYIDQTYWKDQVQYFSPKYRVVTLDLAGHGKSGRNRDEWTIAQFAKDVEAVLDQLDLRNVILISHSMGGDIALETAIARPERIIGFIGIENFKSAGMPLPPEQAAQVDTILEQLRTDFANTNEKYARMALFTPQTDNAITQRVIQEYRNGYSAMGQSMSKDIFNYAPREKALLPQLRQKLYLINVDYMPTNEAPLQELPGAGYELLAMHGTSHFPMLEHPQELNRLLEQSIQKITAGR